LDKENSNVRQTRHESLKFLTKLFSVFNREQSLISRSELLNIFAVNVCSWSYSLIDKCYKVKVSLRNPYAGHGDMLVIGSPCYKIHNCNIQLSLRQIYPIFWYSL